MKWILELHDMYGMVVSSYELDEELRWDNYFTAADIYCHCFDRIHVTAQLRKVEDVPLEDNVVPAPHETSAASPSLSLVA